MNGDTIDYSKPALDVYAESTSLIHERFEMLPHPERLFYHVARHTTGVSNRAQLIGRAMQLTDRELLLVHIAACFHDVVQTWAPVSKGEGVVVRQRFAGLNEVASANEAVKYMHQLGMSFSPAEMGYVTLAIIATIPGWDINHATVIQPFIISTSHPIARAVALADLGEAGMDAEAFAESGPLIFAEDQMDIIQVLLSTQSASVLSSDIQDSYRNRFIRWLEIQPKFARGRQALLSRELDGLGNLTGSVAHLFTQFDQSIQLAEQAVEEAKSLEFVPLMRRILPNAFPSDK